MSLYTIKSCYPPCCLATVSLTFSCLFSIQSIQNCDGDRFVRNIAWSCSMIIISQRNWGSNNWIKCLTSYAPITSRFAHTWHSTASNWVSAKEIFVVGSHPRSFAAEVRIDHTMTHFICSSVYPLGYISWRWSSNRCSYCNILLLHSSSQFVSTILWSFTFSKCFHLFVSLF